MQFGKKQVKNAGKRLLSDIFPNLYYSYIFSRFFCTALR